MLVFAILLAAGAVIGSLRVWRNPSFINKSVALVLIGVFMLSVLYLAERYGLRDQVPPGMFAQAREGASTSLRSAAAYVKPKLF